MDWETIKVREQDTICFVQLHRPEANNTINERMVVELREVLARCEESATVVVIEGLPEVFCFGLDFKAVSEQRAREQTQGSGGPEPLYDLWHELARGSFVSVANVRGKVNAGGVGFVAACDVVLADETAVFSLSELLFGLMPAIVMPYLVRRVGHQRARYLSLMTKPISVAQAVEWGLVDASDENGQRLLRLHLLRLRRLSKKGIARYKRYMNTIDDSIARLRPAATAANRDVFSDPENMEKIVRFVETGQFPWE